MNKLFTFLILMTLALTVNAQSRYAAHSLLESGKWVKIRVKNEGVYQLTKSDLTKMGFSNPNNVRLYGYNVPVLPETNLESMDDDLTEIPALRKSDGTMLFYSCGTIQWTRKDRSSSDPSLHVFTHKNNPYSSYIYYLLTEDSSVQPLALESDEDVTATHTMTTFPDHALVESDEYSFLNAGRTFFESYDYSTGNTRTYTVPMPGIASTDVNLAYQFCAAGSSSSSLNVYSGETTLGTLYFNKLAEYIYGDVKNKSVTWKNVVSDKPTLKFTHTRSSGVTGHLDYIRASYERNLEIGNEGYLVFRTTYAGNFTATIAGANENTRVLRVTSPSLTIQESGTYSNGSYTAKICSTDSDDDTFVAINTNATFTTPETVGKVSNQDLHVLDSIDFVIITPANGKLTTQAQRLADAHAAKEGMRCVVVEADKIYNEFSSGTPDATAYRRFLKMLYDKSEGKGPKNVLLFGNCLWDNRLITPGMKSKNQNDLLLCYESENSVSHTDSYVAEEYFTLLADGKGVSPLKEKPDCGVGRLPVTTVAEAKDVVDKLIRYIYGTDNGSWQNTICLLADDGNANTHSTDAENVWSNTSKIYPNYRYKKIYWDSYERKQSSTGNSYPDAYNEINKTMTDGALIMNYTGHGAAYCLSHEQVLKTKDFQNWDSPRLPLWITAACDVVPFDMNTTNIGVEAVLNSKGAAMGFLGTSRTVYSSPNYTLNRNFMKHVLETKNNGERYTIGEALSQAKSDIIGSGKNIQHRDSLNKAHFILIGDPAITLPTPTYKVCIDKFNGKDAQASVQTISAGETVTVEGHIEDEYGSAIDNYDGIISPTVFDSEEEITCKDNDQSAAKAGKDPLTYIDRTRIIFTGSDSIRSGKFTFTFPMPLDINYSNKNGMISLYAVNSAKTHSANGKFEDFLIGGTTDEEQTDTIGPSITVAVEGKNAQYVSDSPTIRITLSDESGINTTGNGIGHDIVAILDNNEATTYTLNSYYNQAVGDYSVGTIIFTIPSLTPGEHTLTVRAFDTFNNKGEESYKFEVVEGLKIENEIFDMAGRLMLNADSKSSLPKGVYISRTRITCAKGLLEEKSEKFIVTQ